MKQQPESHPAWRRTTARPAGKQSVIAIMHGELPPSTGGFAFVTHFMDRPTIAIRILRWLGIKTESRGTARVAYDTITIDQVTRTTVLGIEWSNKRSRRTFFMHHISEAKNDGRNVFIHFPDSVSRIRSICRPIGFTQAINRMLSNPQPPENQHCGRCAHYQPLPTHANRGNCALGAPEPSSDCPQHATQHWCPAFTHHCLTVPEQKEAYPT